MRRVALGLLIGAVLGAVLAWCGLTVVSTRTTLTRLSPAETHRASLVERDFLSLDRNIQVRLEDLVQGQTTTILRSPDEGGPYGSERLIWSKDGKWLLLVGRHFFVKEEFYLENGDQAYFLYDLSSKKGWINSDGSAMWPALTKSMMESIEFTEPIRLKQR